MTRPAGGRDNPETARFCGGRLESVSPLVHEVETLARLDRVP